MIDPSQDQKIIDPACGSGGFLIEALRYVWQKVQDRGDDLGWPSNEIESEKQKIAIKNFRGIDKDSFLSKVAKVYMAILGDGRGGVFCENSLDNPLNWTIKTRNSIQFGEFDIVITNPPFGKKLSIESEEILKQYDLAYKWNYDKDTDCFTKDNLQDKQTPQILFIERCLNLLKDGGKLGIVLLESIFGMPKYRYVVDYLQRNTKILAVVTMPEDLFQPHTHAKCCVLICEKLSNPSTNDHQIFMADAKWCGHDSRGNPTIRKNASGEYVILDDIPKIAPIFREGSQKE
jgi:type I restriction enzyme M protein